MPSHSKYKSTIQKSHCFHQNFSISKGFCYSLLLFSLLNNVPLYFLLQQLALYKFDPLERTVTLWHLINDVGTAPITSFHLLRMFLGVDTISVSVYIGDSNSLLHNYAIIDKKFQLKQTFDANKSPIKFMERVVSPVKITELEIFLFFIRQLYTASLAQLI